MSDRGEKTRAPSDEVASRELERLGYAQELLRRMGGFSSFAVSFSIISVLTGCITAYKDAVGPGGPIALGLGWPMVSAGTMLVALAMAELASAFPTAGALYHWSALLGGARWGWVTAAMNIIGQIAIVAAIDFGCASELSATLGFASKGAAIGLFVAIVASHALFNAFRVRIVAWLNDFSATVHVLGVVVLVALLLGVGRAQPASFLFHAYTNRDDGSLGLGFLNGLVLSMFTFTGYDASAHLSEETHDPARSAPRGIVTSVAVSAVCGYLLLAGITLAIRDLPAVANDPHAALVAMRGSLGDGLGRVAMALALAAMWFCGLSSVTSASRTIFAFSRDGGLPFSRTLARVSPTAKTPVAATCAATLGPVVLVLGVTPFSDVLFDAMAKMATMGLYVSYAAPILLGARARMAGRWTRMGPFHLRGFGVVVAWLAVGWSAFVLVVCCLPPNQLPAKMLLGCVLTLGILWTTIVRRRFEGPKVDLASLEQKANERDP